MRDRDGAALCVLWLLVAAVAPAALAPATAPPPVCAGPVRGPTADCVAGTATDGAPGRVAPPESVSDVGVGAVHARGVTGEDVRVGVIGSAFDPDRRAIADNVVSRTTVAGSAPAARGDPAHDTAVVELVARTAPDSDIYLAGVGRRPTPAEYEAAVERLVSRDVEVIVDAGSYLPRDPAAADRIAAVARRAAARGVVFVTSAGNYGQRHWEGRGADRGWVDFADGTQANPLDGGDPVRGVVSLRLRWNSSADYDLYLYRRLPGGDRVVASATTRGSDPEAVDVAVPRGTYYVAVYAHAGTSPRDRVELFAARHGLAYTTSAGSVAAPGTSETVLTVGAMAGRTDRFRSYSSRGDTVDVGAPDRLETRSAGTFEGTSAAAPVVAGTAALMTARNHSLSPRTVEAILERTAENGTRLDAAAAVEAVPAPTGAATEPGRSAGTTWRSTGPTTGGEGLATPTSSSPGVDPVTAGDDGTVPAASADDEGTPGNGTVDAGPDAGDDAETSGDAGDGTSPTDGPDGGEPTATPTPTPTAPESPPDSTRTPEPTPADPEDDA